MKHVRIKTLAGLAIVVISLIGMGCDLGGNQNFMLTADMQLRIPLTYVQGSTFQMGEDISGSAASPSHAVSLDSYYIGTYEITQDIYEQVMGKNPSFNKGERLPVEMVSWYEAVEFCNALSRRFGFEEVYTIRGRDIICDWDKRGIRLPTEAEWEYATRGGLKTQNYTSIGSDFPNSVAWHAQNSAGSTHEVGLKDPNELGIYDMGGNVKEFVWDRYGAYTASAKNNPTGADVDTVAIVVRGGSFQDSPTHVTPLYRQVGAPMFKLNQWGFRIVLPSIRL